MDKSSANYVKKNCQHTSCSERQGKLTCNVCGKAIDEHRIIGRKRMSKEELKELDKYPFNIRNGKLNK